MSHYLASPGAAALSLGLIDSAYPRPRRKLPSRRSYFGGPPRNSHVVGRGAAATPPPRQAPTEEDEKPRRYIARDLRTPRCRAFAAALGCAWFDEVVCWSDRDQLSFPYALQRLGLAASYPATAAVDEVVFRAASGRPAAIVLPPGRPPRAKRAALHWYYTHALAVGKCLPCVRHRTDPFAGSIGEVAERAAAGF